MVEVYWDEYFQKQFSKIRDNGLRERILSHIRKITDFPEIGKPMMHLRKGTREVYIGHYRLSYLFEQDKVVVLEVYHKDEQ